ALAMSSTAIALGVLQERGHLQLTYGQRAFAILLFQDMAVVPLLALLPLLAPYGGGGSGSLAHTLAAIGLAAAAIAAVVVAGRYLLNPLFRVLAASGAREAMTAAALLVVLGTALLMHAAGMSMALGAFLAGVLLAESNYRHELEADIEPFRGLLLALFFMGIGMGIDLTLVWANLWLVVGGALVVMALKAAVVWGLFRFTCARQEDALRAGSVLTPAGEFAFVLLPLGGALGVLGGGQSSLLAAVAALTMLIASPASALLEAVLRRGAKPEEGEADSFDGARGAVLLIGFGRFGQIVSQCLLAEGVDVTIIDRDAEMIQSAGKFGFKIYYGDGGRLDVLRAAGADKARLVAVCIDDRDATNRIVEVVRADFPGTQLYVRSYDRAHTLELIGRGVDYELRELYESALVFGGETLLALGVDAEAAQATLADLRQRDRARLVLQQAEGIYAGMDTLHRQPKPEPLSEVRRRARALNPEAGPLIEGSAESARPPPAFFSTSLRAAGEAIHPGGGCRSRSRMDCFVASFLAMTGKIARVQYDHSSSTTPATTMATPRASRAVTFWRKITTDTACANSTSISASVRTLAAVASAKAANQNSDASAPMKPANIEGRHARRIATSTSRSRTRR
ncbi:MAG: cation:proton antiporter, partial [Variibacter sp.]|nr:cation:proton antiporter [Variibacter sp.]